MWHITHFGGAQHEAPDIDRINNFIDYFNHTWVSCSTSNWTLETIISYCWISVHFKLCIVLYLYILKSWFRGSWPHGKLIWWELTSWELTLWELISWELISWEDTVTTTCMIVNGYILYETCICWKVPLSNKVGYWNSEQISLSYPFKVTACLY